MNAKDADQNRNHQARGGIAPQAINDGTNKRQGTIKHLADQTYSRRLEMLKRRHHRIDHTLKHQSKSSAPNTKKAPLLRGLKAKQSSKNHLTYLRPR